MSKKSDRMLKGLMQMQIRLLALMTGLSIRLDALQPTAETPEQHDDNDNPGRHRAEP